jgi:glycosyltransferase involved in cell wall biosynthesis
MRPYLERATVLPIPLFSGGGTRYKALEAFAAGVPVVSTAKGIEGIDVRPGEHYLPAESAPEFAAAIQRLCERQELRAELRARARELVESRYSRPVITQGMVEALTELPAPPEPARSAGSD